MKRTVPTIIRPIQTTGLVSSGPTWWLAHQCSYRNGLTTRGSGPGPRPRFQVTRSVSSAGRSAELGRYAAYSEMMAKAAKFTSKERGIIMATDVKLDQVDGSFLVLEGRVVKAAASDFMLASPQRPIEYNI